MSARSLAARRRAHSAMQLEWALSEYEADERLWIRPDTQTWWRRRGKLVRLIDDH